MTKTLMKLTKKFLWMAIPFLVMTAPFGIFSEMISNKSQLEVMLKEETAKLGIGNKKIIVEIGKPRGGLGSCEHLKDGGYKIVLGLANKSNLRHELYHIYRGDVEKENFNLLKYLYQEPRAILYQDLGIKL